MHKLEFLLIFIFGFFSLSFADETLTITTYYPSPYGSYSQLTADQIAIGSTYRNPTYADGTLYVSGNVGIGTTSPNSSKGTGGYLDAKDVYLRDAGKWASVAGGLTGYVQVSASCNAGFGSNCVATANCGSGKVVLSGVCSSGCSNCGPSGSTGWTATFSCWPEVAENCNPAGTVLAICANGSY